MSINYDLPCNVTSQAEEYISNYMSNTAYKGYYKMMYVQDAVIDVSFEQLKDADSIFELMGSGIGPHISLARDTTKPDPNIYSPYGFGGHVLYLSENTVGIIKGKNLDVIQYNVSSSAVAHKARFLQVS